LAGFAETPWVNINPRIRANAPAITMREREIVAAVVVVFISFLHSDTQRFVVAILGAGRRQNIGEIT
jgi:hypothetical protein